MNSYKPLVRFSYEKLRKILRKRRMTISAFAKRTGISRSDIHMMQLDELMSPEGEYRACFFLKCDTSDIRDMYPIEPYTDFTHVYKSHLVNPEENNTENEP